MQTFLADSSFEKLNIRINEISSSIQLQSLVAFLISSNKAYMKLRTFVYSGRRRVSNAACSV
jgi:hypothetical protein